MGRRKAKRPELSLHARAEGIPLFDENTEVDLNVSPGIMEKSVHKRVPAVIHWDQVTGTDRTDDEVIGEAIIYDDGTSDVMVFGELSDEAKKLVGIINSRLDTYSIED